MKYLLDTHAALWLFTGSSKLGKQAQRKLQRSGKGELCLCDVSLYELATLNARGRIDFTDDFLQRLSDGVCILPVDATVAARASSLALPHGDPFDRIIVAAALEYGLVLVTKDSAVVDSGLVKILW